MFGHWLRLRPGTRAFLRLKLTAALLAFLFIPDAAAAQHGFDHRLNRDESGIWSRSNQQILHVALIGAAVGGSLVEGTESRLGLAFWRATEAATIEKASVALLKRGFSRARPREGNDPDLWFQGRGHQSFPSDEVALAAAVVTPFIREYRQDHPAVWTLSLIPAYVGVARMKSQAHWQTDVLASVGIGVALGVLAGQHEQPLFISLTGGGPFVGLRYRW